MSSRLYNTFQYLLNLLRSSRFHLLRFLHLIAHCIGQSWPARTPIRPRALTAPPSPRTTPSAPETPPTTSTQLQSPLFHLPLEIRRLIYRHTLVSGVTHIVRLGPRLGHVRCRDRHHVRPWPHRCWGAAVTGSDLHHVSHDEPLNDEETEEDKRGLLPLIMACRQIYIEAIPVLYGDNTFSMLHLESMISLADTILPQRLNGIRSVELGWYFYIPYPLYTRKFQPMDYPPYDIATWERVWFILANMESLMRLRVDLVGRWIEPLTADEERQLLGPAMEVKRPRMWDMRIDWEDTEVDWEAQGAPFRIVRDERTWDEGNTMLTSVWN
ncbi:MAG: hypothetical protein ASARMPREDX12_003273 [Alectoria sarmentosa]|nr:MAG: hypothetical protein ASARMPREDX12_003273 [Alectoria sarmentosa]